MIEITAAFVVGLVVGLALGILGTVVFMPARTKHVAPDAEPVKEPEPIGWERSVRAMRERQKSNNQ